MEQGFKPQRSQFNFTSLHLLYLQYCKSYPLPHHFFLFEETYLSFSHQQDCYVNI
jgi:hypothetical protein